MYINPLNAIDFYKTDHRRQYPEGTTEVYSNFTARSAKAAKVLPEFFDNKIVFFGLQFFIRDFLINTWNEHFFKKSKKEVISAYQRRMDFALGKNTIETLYLEKLHDLGYLPLKIKSLPEGSQIPIGVPCLTIVNTHPDFFWLTNYIETALSSYLWKPITSATTAFEYKKLMLFYAKKTASPKELIPFQVHDFSFRGMSGVQEAALSGAGHLTSFYGTDTVPAIDLLEEFYYAHPEQEIIGCSVPATEHSVMSMALPEGELALFKRLINELYPRGVVSIVSDTWDFWKVLTEYMPALKADILKRDGKVVLRPDSGDCVKIVAGDPDADKNSAEYKGALECLWEIFGGSLTSKGYKLLDPHIGIIYGDSISLERANNILKAMEAKGFASGNIVFGVGSFTYQNVTRDSFGFAVKATSGVVNGKRRNIYKSPKTDTGLKKSAQGLLRVERENNILKLYDNQSEKEENRGLLEVTFLNGKLTKPTTLSEIRKRIDENL